MIYLLETQEFFPETAASAIFPDGRALIGDHVYRICTKRLRTPMHWPRYTYSNRHVRINPFHVRELVRISPGLTRLEFSDVSSIEVRCGLDRVRQALSKAAA